MEGWIKSHRKLLENPIVCKDADHLAVWTYLLLKATHREHDSIFKGERITLKPGQLIAGRKSIASFLKINESKVQRILKSFEIEHQIEQQTSNQNRLITILNWDMYQGDEQQNEQRVNNKRTTSEQRVNTNKNEKNEKNIDSVSPSPSLREKKKFSPPTLDEVKEYATTRGRIDLAKRFFDYYHAGDWKDKDGKPVKNWKQKFITWENHNPQAEVQHNKQNQLDLTGRW